MLKTNAYGADSPGSRKGLQKRSILDRVTIRFCYRENKILNRILYSGAGSACAIRYNYLTNFSCSLKKKTHN